MFRLGPTSCLLRMPRSGQPCVLCPNDNKETRIFSLYAVVDPSAASDRKIEPLMAATAKTTNASMGKAP